MNDFENILTKEKALALLNFAGRVPIKVKPTKSTHRGCQHWMKGVLLGVKGDDAVWRPLNNHGARDETAPLDTCRLWKSRMTPELLQLVVEVYAPTSLNTVDQAINSALTPLLEKVDDQMAMKPNGMPSVQDYAEVIDVTPTHRPSVLPGLPPVELSFEEKMQQFKRLRAEIQQDGLNRLVSLRRDRKDAEEMLAHINTQIQDLEKALGQEEIQKSKPKRKLSTKREYHTPVYLEMLSGLKKMGTDWYPSKMVQQTLGHKGRFDGFVVWGVKNGHLERQGERNLLSIRLKPAN